MAKQTFTVGQVLTAAQVTSLQQTAMGGGAASAKTASYTLVAADAGTTISMTSTSATTITVNTGLFAAGDTVFIQNLGSGVSTITPGTATVNTSASLALAQYEGGTLYFTSASASLFFKADGAAAGGGGMTQMGTATTLTGSSTTITIDAGYNNVQVVLRDLALTSGGHLISCRFNADSGSNYFQTNYYGSGTTAGSEVVTTTGMRLTASPVSSNTNADATFIVNIYDYLNTASKRIITYQGNYVAAGGSDQTASNGVCGYLTVGTAISSITILTSGTLVGTALVYGVK